MIKVLITGANSYIGTSFENYVKNDEEYLVTTLDMKDENWINHDFSKYDVVFHVAGIAHDTSKKKDQDLYYKVNRDLTLKTAEKAKNDGVKQFIFMSSMLVYNGCKERKITLETKPKVKGFYGDSKLQADLGLQKLNSEEFKVVILRPPMIFGENCKGNFPRLAKLAKKVPIFPNINNKRSMLYVGNLCEYIKEIIKNEEQGIFFPQNKKYFATSEIVRIIAKENNKKIWFTKLFNWGVYLLRPFVSVVNKLFGDLYYEIDDPIKFNALDNEECIKKASETF